MCWELRQPQLMEGPGAAPLPLPDNKEDVQQDPAKELCLLGTARLNFPCPKPEIPDGWSM